MNNITPEKFLNGKTSEVPPAKISDGDAQEMLHVGLVNMPDGTTLNLEDRSKLLKTEVTTTESKFCQIYPQFVFFFIPICFHFRNTLSTNWG